MGGGSDSQRIVVKWKVGRARAASMVESAGNKV